MSGRGAIKTPTNQKVLTNVAVVRLKREKDIDEVLQTQTVFTNVSKGQFAKKEELKEAFGTDAQLDCCKIILEKGDLQVSDKERQAASDSAFKEVAQQLASMVVNPETKRPVPPSAIDKALHEIHFALKPGRSAKQQALDILPKLRESMKIERAKMRIRVSIPTKEGRSVQSRLKQIFADIELENWDEVGLELVGLLEPGSFRKLEDFVKNETKGEGRMEILSLKDVNEEELEIA